MINKNHPKYPEYVAKCTQLTEDGEREIHEIFESGVNAPVGFDVEIRKRYMDEIKATTREYAKLFAKSLNEETTNEN